MSSFAPAMGALKARLASILDLVPPGAPLAYLDYPVHENVGDLLIMLGTEAFFADYRLSVRYRASALNFHPHPFLRDPKTVILCHGGGNLGDLYSTFQSFRESVVREYRGNRIIVLPQTVHFEDPRKRDAAGAVFRDHPDLHLCVRDEESYRVAAEHLARNVYLVPDMAHQLWPVRDPGAGAATARRPELLLIRTDKEIAGLPAAVEARRSEFRDWAGQLGRAELALLHLAVRALRVDALLHNSLPAAWTWRLYARRRVERAIRLFGRHERIVTSRLHAHILACLMSKPSLLIDNSYGKNSSYYRAWTRGIPGAELA
jgi:pyruvyl transferase EpsO